jgi:hypothetical protein
MRPDFPIIDCHVHLVDFLQDSDGLPAMLERMDAAGIAKAVVFGMPVVKKWDCCEPLEPHYYLEDNARCYYYSLTDQIVADAHAALPVVQRARLAPLMCGFNPTDRHGVRHLERMFQSYPGWRGVGEVLLRHDDLTNLILEETARANHPAMDPVYEFCVAQRLPIVLHQNSSSVGRHNEYLYLHELEETLARHPKLTSVWAHCGLSRRVSHDRYHEMIARMLATYPGLHVDLSWIGYDDIMCLAGEIRPEWVELVEQFPSRVMIGSDLVGHFNLLTPTMGRYLGLLAKLTPSTRGLVASGNADRLFFGVESNG